MARPFFQGKPGHPVGFSCHLRESLLGLDDGQGAAPLLRRDVFDELGIPGGVVVIVDAEEALCAGEACRRQRLSISISDSAMAAPDFHARFSAIAPSRSCARA